MGYKDETKNFSLTDQGVAMKSIATANVNINAFSIPYSQYKEFLDDYKNFPYVLLQQEKH